MASSFRGERVKKRKTFFFEREREKERKNGRVMRLTVAIVRARSPTYIEGREKVAILSLIGCCCIMLNGILTVAF